MKEEEVLDNLGKRLATSFFENDEIISTLVDRLQHKANIFISRSVDRAHERIKEAAGDKAYPQGIF